MATGGGEQEIVSEESVDINCEICTRKGRVNHAHKYCKDCKKNLCTVCAEYHDYLIEGHRLGETQRNGDETTTWMEKCPKHKTQLLNTFCIGHDKLVCGVCVLMEHKNCQKEDLSKSTIGPNKDQKVQKIKEQLEAALQNVDQVIVALDSRADILKALEHQFLNDVEAYTKKLTSKIEDLKKRAEKAVTIEHQKFALEIKETRETCMIRKTDINKLTDAMNRSSARIDSMGVLLKRGEILTGNVETLCRYSLEMVKTEPVIFKPDWRIEDSLSDFHSLVSEEERYNTSQIGDFKVCLPVEEDKSCDIHGCCVLPNGYVLLTDAKNKMLKLVHSTTGKVKNNLRVDGFIRGIACLNQHEVAVSSSNTHVKMFNICRGIRYTRTLGIQCCCHVDFCNREWFVSTKDYIYVYDMTGTKIRTISENNTSFPAQFNRFHDISGMAVNLAGDRLFVTDTCKGLVCMDIHVSGKVIFKRSPTELGVTTAHGVCTDKAGHVFVCGYDSNNVVQVSEDGRVVGQILGQDDGIVKPRCLCYDVDRHRLCVAGDTSQLKVFRLG